MRSRVLKRVPCKLPASGQLPSMRTSDSAVCLATRAWSTVRSTYPCSARRSPRRRVGWRKTRPSTVSSRSVGVARALLRAAGPAGCSISGQVFAYYQVPRGRCAGGERPSRRMDRLLSGRVGISGHDGFGLPAPRSLSPGCRSMPYLAERRPIQSPPPARVTVIESIGLRTSTTAAHQPMRNR
jgi:hypothetical protein